jgi:uncharacterized membrane protein YesL
MIVGFVFVSIFILVMGVLPATEKNHHLLNKQIMKNPKYIIKLFMQEFDRKIWEWHIPKWCENM